ncbi:MAG TPA: hypothetical protein VJS12_07960, partial [Steroidobacteraceae bacterium]|nr:hypothetical protein [Steroidobacteraceae bacterium]
MSDEKADEAGLSSFSHPVNPVHPVKIFRLLRERHTPSAAYSASAAQINTNPATRGPLNGSPNANTARISWMLG